MRVQDRCVGSTQDWDLALDASVVSINKAMTTENVKSDGGGGGGTKKDAGRVSRRRISYFHGDDSSTYLTQVP